MKKSIQLFMMLTGILCGTVSQLRAQTCPAPVSATISTTDAVCFGAGSITVNTVTLDNGTVLNPAPSNGSMQYILIYDSVGSANNNQQISSQSSPTFTQISRGTYKVVLQSLCSGNSANPVSTYDTIPVTVNGRTTILTIDSVHVDASFSLCSSGNVQSNTATITASGGGGDASAWTYALVSSVDPNATVITGPQSSNVFTGLTTGATYYARVYDICGSNNSATLQFTVPTVGSNLKDSARFSSTTISYTCSSNTFSFTPFLTNYGRNTTGAPDPAEQLWYTLNGVTTPITGWSYNSATNNSVSANYNFTQQFTQYPDTITYGYQSVCGTTFTGKLIITNPPSFAVSATSRGSSCTTANLTINTNASNTIGKYIANGDTTSINVNSYNGNYFYSIDNGATWSTGNSFTVQPGDIDTILVASCNDTVRLIDTIPFSAKPTVSLVEGNGVACNGNSGFSIQIANASGISASSITIQTLSQPDGANIPQTFTFNNVNGNSTLIVDNHLTYNLPLGYYQLHVTGDCGVDTTVDITLSKPANFSVSSVTQTTCQTSTATQGYTLTTSFPNIIASGNLNSNVYVVVTNNSTGAKSNPYHLNGNGTGNVTYNLNSSSMPTIFPPTDGTTYDIQVYRQVTSGSVNTQSTCAFDTTVTYQSVIPITVQSVIVTSGCADNTATVGISVQGGSGNYQYTLQSSTDGGNTWTTVGATQTSPIFNGLVEDKLYQIIVTSLCGTVSSQTFTYNVQFTNSPLTFAFNTSKQPCPGDTLVLSLPNIPGATYTWQVNNETISNTGNTYTYIVPETDVTVFGVSVQLGTCTIASQTYTLDPGNCSQPFATPLTGFQLSAQIQANNAVQLNWETKMEINSKNFTVQRSADGGKTWTDVGTVATKAVNGNSSTPLSYTLTDQNVQPGSYEYQVVETDINGNSTTSNIVQIQVTSSGAKVYPIPASTYVRIILPAGVNAVPYRMISTDGKVVLQGSMSNQGNFGQISVSGLASAVYFLQVTINNAVQTYKVQVQH